MSATHHRHLNLLTSATHSTAQFLERSNISDRFVQLLEAIEDFLLTCTYAEMCNFWNAIADLRQKLQKCTEQPQMPHFLTNRRKQRDFCRILEVLADLPQLHLSDRLADKSGDRSNSQLSQSRQSQSRQSSSRQSQYTFANPHLAIQR